MNQGYVQLAIPVFFLLIGVELAVARLVEREVYRLSDSVSDLSCGRPRPRGYSEVGKGVFPPGPGYARICATQPAA